MSREIDNTGKIIVCDKVIETSQRTTEADMSSDLSTLNGTFGFSVGQKQFSKDFSMSLSGSPNVSDSVPASLRVDIYRNGTRLDISNPIVKGSSLLWESMDGKFMKFGEYTETFMQEIGVGILEKNKEKFKVTWTTKDADSVPLTAAIDVYIGEKVQYALSKYIDQSKVAEDAVVWFDTMEGALGVSHPYNCYLWTRSSSYYDFTNKCYVDWKYFKGDLYYEGQSVDDTVDDMAGKLNKYIEFTSSTDRFTVDKRSNGSDTIRMGVNINGYSNVSFKWSADIQLSPDGQENNQEIAFVVPHDNDYQSIKVEVEVSYTEGEETKVVTHQFNLFPIDITKPEMYLGVLDSIPDGDYISSLQKKVMTGDWFLLSSTNELYTWNGSAWVCINGDSVTGTTFKDLEKVSVALVDMIKIGTNDKTTATIIGVFKMLCADNGFIKFLKTWALFCGSGSETSGFYCRIADHDPATGESLANPVFIVKYNGNTVFQIDPSSGNVFFGEPNSDLKSPLSGFMYDATSKIITSKSNNVVIYEDGRISGNFVSVLQYMPYNFDDSLDSEHPFECEFYIPQSSVIKGISLSVKGRKYRAYSKAVDYKTDWGVTTGGVTWHSSNPWGVQLDLKVSKTNTIFTTTGSAGGHTHSYSKAINAGGHSGDGEHSHTIGSNWQGNIAESSGSGHKHSLLTESSNTGESGEHSHSLPELVTDVSGTLDTSSADFNHTHDLDVSHGHDLSFGIFEGTMPSDVKLFIDNGNGYATTGIDLGSNEILASDFDITSHLSGYGWKKIKFTSSTLGRLTVQLIAELLVTTQ